MEMGSRDCASAWAFHRRFAEPFDAGERTFPHHYLLCASSGAFHLELAGRCWLLPPHRAALIRSGVAVRIWTRTPVTSASVLFTPSPAVAFAADCSVFHLSELARDMVAYGMRWDQQHAARDPQAGRWFAALADLCLELSRSPDNYWLPRASTPELNRALQFTARHLGQAMRFGDVAEAACVSERTLARRFVTETGMTWREYVRRARLIAAMQSLAESGESIAQIANGCGFESLSAFNAAFRAFADETPSAYRRRIASGDLFGGAS
jgi:AraC-like DNA-binding protein